MYFLVICFIRYCVSKLGQFYLLRVKCCVTSTQINLIMSLAHLMESVNSISDNWNDNLQSFIRDKNEALVPVFYVDWASVPVPHTSSLRGLDIGFIPPLPKELLIRRTMANNDRYNDK